MKVWDALTNKEREEIHEQFKKDGKKLPSIGDLWSRGMAKKVEGKWVVEVRHGEKATFKSLKPGDVFTPIDNRGNVLENKRYVKTKTVNKHGRRVNAVERVETESHDMSFHDGAKVIVERKKRRGDEHEHDS